MRRALIHMAAATCLAGGSLAVSTAALAAPAAASADQPRPSRADALARVEKVIKATIDTRPGSVTETARFSEDLNADSLDKVELIMAFEDEFHIKIPDDAADRLLTVGQAADYVATGVVP